MSSQLISHYYKNVKCNNKMLTFNITFNIAFNIAFNKAFNKAFSLIGAFKLSLKVELC